MTSDHYRTLGVAALLVGVQPHKLAKLAKRNAFPFEKAGRFHIIKVTDLDAVRAACVKAGYLPAPEALEAAHAG